LVELGARSMDLVDLEFLELGCLARKSWSGVVFVDLELRGALPNTPLENSERVEVRVSGRSRSVGPSFSSRLGGCSSSSSSYIRVLFSNCGLL
jgi:hypothetical protein